MMFFYFLLFAVGKLNCLKQDLSSGLTWFVYLEPHLIVHLFEWGRVSNSEQYQLYIKYCSNGWASDMTDHFKASAGQKQIRIAEMLY